MRKYSLILSLCLSFYLSAEEATLSFSLATTELPPFVYLDENKQAQGSLVDMLTTAQQHSSMRIHIMVMPWARAFQEVKKGSIDALMPTLMTEERQNFFVFPRLPLAHLGKSVLIKRIEDPFEFTGLAALDNLKVIGMLRHAMIDEEFHRLAKSGNLNIYETTRLDDALLMLAQEKIDLVASDATIALTTINKLGLEKRFQFYTLRLDGKPSYIAFSPAFAKTYDVNQIMEQILNTAGD
ncbi:MAG: amino acid ABC transporter substrate-binding protein [Paraglaciecola sp.]|nr:amino acid ABC transporter substrate-binding protein [Paraglaciecola sp.]